MVLFRQLFNISKQFESYPNNIPGISIGYSINKASCETLISQDAIFLILSKDDFYQFL